jgi:UDP-MurNAc hydroxylase
MIQTTLIGHACLLIQSRETTILTDPCWFDYLWEEINVLCPSIVLEKDKVPPIDVLYLSHRHQDHFDVRTLAYLAQKGSCLTPDTMVLVPNDDILIDVLKELEFKNVQVVADFTPIKIKDVTLTPTPSLNKASTAKDDFPEHGLLVNDGEVTLWNQVDTIVSPEIIDQIRQLYGQVDFMHGRFVPLLEGNFSYNKPMDLPYDEYCTYLNVVRALSPKFVVPGSASFRYRDELNFLNQYSFPTTQDQFLSDLAAFCPGVPSSPYVAGDVAHIAPGEIRIDKQSSGFVRVREDDSHLLAFKPVMEVPPVRTRTTDDDQYEKETGVIQDFMENQFMKQILASEILDGWKHWQIVYQLEIFGCDGSEIWSIDFGQAEIKLHKGALGKINLYEGIATSEFCDLIEEKTSWDYVTLCGNYRTFNNIYRVTDGRFEIPPKDSSNLALEPLMVLFPWDKKMDREKFMKDVRRWKGVPQG